MFGQHNLGVKELPIHMHGWDIIFRVFLSPPRKSRSEKAVSDFALKVTAQSAGGVKKERIALPTM